jgi:RNA polymerase sigma-70 factor (ECF subfamily)
MPELTTKDLVALLPRLRRFAQSLTGNADDANDLVQAALERALKAMATLDDDAMLDAWMFRIIRNLWIDGLRKRRSEGVHETIEDWSHLSDVDGRTATEARLTARKAAAAMTRLPHDQQEVLRRVCVEGQSYKDAARELDIPIGTVMLSELGLSDDSTLKEARP